MKGTAIIDPHSILVSHLRQLGAIFNGMTWRPQTHAFPEFSQEIPTLGTFSPPVGDELHPISFHAINLGVIYGIKVS